MAKSLGAFAKDMRQFPETLEKATADATGKAALQMTQVARRRISAAAGGDSRLSNMGRRGAKVGARYDMRKGPNPSALVKATGPLHILERDTKPHDMPRQRRRGRRRVMNTPWGPRAFVKHPGTKGQAPFAKAVAEEAPKVPLVYARELRAAMRKHFGG